MRLVAKFIGFFCVSVVHLKENMKELFKIFAGTFYI